MQQLAMNTASTSSLRYALEQMGGGAELGVRLNYSLALTRFVNSVVDSHQTGGFAQSVAAIAARIGLPLWFVEIRHAVTHEELPSISVCRQAVRSALAWLHRHFWIPQLFEGPNAMNLGASNRDASAMDLDRPQGASASASTSVIAGSASKKDITEEEETRRKDRSKALHDLRKTLKATATSQRKSLAIAVSPTPQRTTSEGSTSNSPSLSRASAPSNQTLELS